MKFQCVQNAHNIKYIDKIANFIKLKIFKNIEKFNIYIKNIEKNDVSTLGPTYGIIFLGFNPLQQLRNIIMHNV